MSEEVRKNRFAGGDMASGHKKIPCFDPSNLCVIGDEPEHPCYDPSRVVPPDDAWVATLDSEGVRVPVIIWKDDQGRYCVVEGRRRTLGLCLANKIAKKEGRPEKQIMAVVVTGSPQQIAAMKVMLNVARKDYTPLARAEHVEALSSKYHMSDAQIAIMMSVSPATIRNWKTIASCSAPVKEALRANTIKPSEAIELAVMPRADQGAAVEKLIAVKAGDGPAQVDDEVDDTIVPDDTKPKKPTKMRGAKAKSAAKQIAAGKEPTEAAARRLSSSRIEKIIEEMKQEGEDGKLVSKALRFVIGDTKAWHGKPELLAACKRAGWEA